MTPAMPWRHPTALRLAGGLRGLWRQWDTLALRLFLLMVAALLASQLLVDLLLSGADQLGWWPPGRGSGSTLASGVGRQATAPDDDLPLALWLLEWGLRVAVMAAAAWWGSRWLAAPVWRLVRAAQTLAPAISRGDEPALLPDGEGTREVRTAATLFNQLAAQLRERFEERGVIMAAISHDLRTPLTRMRLRLEGADVDAQLRERCSADIAAMHHLIDSSLEIFRPADAPPDEVPVRLDLAALAQSAVDDLAAGGADVRFEGSSLLLTAHPLPLRRVLDNLLANALRYAGQARVSVRASGGRALLVVDDDGPGIPEQALPNLLRPFTRLETSRNRATGGVGLGLYIAQELARREGATLSLSNRREGGLRVQLSWPLDARP